MTIDADKVLIVGVLVLVEAMKMCVRHEGICFKVHRAERIPASSW